MMMRMQVADRLVELPFRLHPSARASITTWPVSASERERIRICWPATYHWNRTSAFADTIKRSLSRLGVVRVCAIPQPHSGVVRVICALDGRAHFVAIDYADRPDEISTNALAECSLYIKLQFREEGYPDSRIIPGGYPASSQHFYRYYRPFRDHAVADARIGVVGRFSYEFQKELRSKAVRMLSEARDIHFVGAGPRVRYSRFLREIAAARLTLDLPGNGPFTFRLSESLGLGSCLMAPRYITALHRKLEPGVHYVAIANDLSDLLDRCRYYLSHDAERETIARAGRDFFDRYLHADHLAAYYLRAMIDRLGDADRQLLRSRAPLDQDGRLRVAELHARHGGADGAVGVKGEPPLAFG